MKPLSWIPGLLVCLFWPSVTVCAQDSLGEPVRSAPALTITAHVQPALIAQVFDSQGHLENSVTSLGSAGKSFLTIDSWTDPDLTVETSSGFVYLRRVEIAVRFAGFRSEIGTITLNVEGSSDSPAAIWVEGPSPDSVLPIDANGPKLVSDSMRSGSRFVRYIGVLMRSPADLNRSKLPKSRVRYEVGLP